MKKDVINESKDTNKSKLLYILIIISLVVAAITVIISIGSLMKPKTKMSVDDFSIKTETKHYTYIADSVYYEGEGIITSSDKKNTYLVVLEEKLVSGGDSDSREKAEETNIVIVTNGIGKFTTFDSGDEGEIEKPQYEFKILGYQKLYK